MRRAPRARGVFSRIRPTASAVIRNHTCWLPSASSTAPNQRIRPVGFPGGVARRQGLGPAGPVLTRPRDDDLRSDGVGHALPPAPPNYQR